MPRLSEDTIRQAVSSLLAHHPDAPVAALTGDGRRCAAPPRLAALFGDRPKVDATSFLDVVRPQDQAQVIAAWANVRSQGAAQAFVELLDAPGVPLTVHFFDTRADHGVLVGVVVERDPGDVGPGVAAPVLLRPRICRMEKDGIGTITGIDDDAVRMLGWTREQSVGQRSLDFVHEDERELAIDSWMQMLAGEGGSSRWRGRMRCADGSWLWVETTNVNRLDEARPHVASELLDVTQEMAVQEALARSEDFLRRLIGALPLGVVQFDADDAVVFCNARAHHLLGSPAGHLDDVSALVVPEDLERFHRAVAHGRRSQATSEVEVNLAVGGERVTVALTMCSTADDRWVMCAMDATDRVNLRRELEVLASYDDLTGCPNRASVLRHLEAVMAADAEAGTATGIVFVDLDDFKDVNDLLGHAAGDAVLCAAASRLRDCCRRADDLVGRLGGDEFLIVLGGLRGREELDRLLRRVETTVDGPVDLGDGLSVRLRASVGGALSDPAMTLDELVAEADSAMYRMKRIHHADGH